VTLEKVASLADDVLDLVLGEQLVTPMEHAVKQYPFLVFYYPGGN
jgi:hypothetical protein